jgi:hypothetical protein
MTTKQHKQLLGKSMIEIQWLILDCMRACRAIWQAISVAAALVTPSPLLYSQSPTKGKLGMRQKTTEI